MLRCSLKPWLLQRAAIQRASQLTVRVSGLRNHHRPRVSHMPNSTQFQARLHSSQPEQSSSSPPGPSDSPPAPGASDSSPPGSSGTSLEPVEVCPPLPIRAALVGLSVGLFTPVLATAGTAMVIWRVIPNNTAGNIFKGLLFCAAGGGVGTICFEHVFPFLLNNSDVLLPFAAANFVTSASWFLAIEAACGTTLMKSGMELNFLKQFKVFSPTKLSPLLPVGAMGIGGLTALTAPLLWPTFINALCGGDAHIALSTLPLTGFYYDWLLGPVAIPIGLLTGFVLHWALKPVVYGMKGKSWQSYSLPLLVALALVALGYFVLYRPSRPSREDLFWVIRRSPETGHLYSYNLYSGKQEEGSKAAFRSKELLQPKKHDILHFARNYQKSQTTAAGAVEKLTRCPNNNVTLSNIPRYTALFDLIDSLVSLKLTQTAAQANPDDPDTKEHLDELNDLAEHTYGIDLSKLLIDIECFLTLAVELDSGRTSPFNRDDEWQTKAKIVTHALSHAILVNRELSDSDKLSIGARQLALAKRIRGVLEHMSENETPSQSVAFLVNNFEHLVAEMSVEVGNGQWIDCVRKRQAVAKFDVIVATEVKQAAREELISAIKTTAKVILCVSIGSALCVKYMGN